MIRVFEFRRGICVWLLHMGFSLLCSFGNMQKTSRQKDPTPPPQPPSLPHTNLLQPPWMPSWLIFIPLLSTSGVSGCFSIDSAEPLDVCGKWHVGKVTTWKKLDGWELAKERGNAGRMSKLFFIFVTIDTLSFSLLTTTLFL